MFAFRGTTDFADLSICSDANILPLYDDPDWDSQVQADGACDECGATAESDAVNAKGESAGAGASRHLKKIQWKCRPFGRSKVHRGIRDAVLWLIHQEGLLKYASKFADAGYEVRWPTGSVIFLCFAGMLVFLTICLCLLTFCQDSVHWPFTGSSMRSAAWNVFFNRRIFAKSIQNPRVCTSSICVPLDCSFNVSVVSSCICWGPIYTALLIIPCVLFVGSGSADKVFRH